jgi:hypothetical protein
MAIGTAIALIAVIFFMIISRGFRWVVGGLLGLAIILFLSMVYDRPERSAPAVSESTHPPPQSINVDDLLLESVTVARPGSGVSGAALDEWRLQGTLTNNSKQQLEGLKFEITVLDCPSQLSGPVSKAPTNCRTVGQQQTDVSSTVPAGQTRTFGSPLLHFSDMPAEDQRYQRQFNWKLISATSDPLATLFKH